MRAVRVGSKRRVTRHGEYRNIASARILFESSSQLEPIDSRNVEIGDDDVGGQFDGALERLKAIVRLRYTEAGLLQPFHEHEATVAVVFDDENARAPAFVCQLRVLD